MAYYTYSSEKYTLAYYRRKDVNKVAYYRRKMQTKWPIREEKKEANKQPITRKDKVIYYRRRKVTYYRRVKMMQTKWPITAGKISK